MKIDEKELEKAHEYCIHNKPKLLKNQKCGCFYCCKTFASKEIIDWVEEEPETALCPYCGIDTVIGEYAGFPLTKEFLDAMRKKWFW